MDQKTFGNVEIKSESKGEIRAVFSTLDVVDKDGDITVKGAMPDGAQVRISAYNHKSWEGALPVGKGVIREVGNEVVLEGQFFMNTTHGRDTFETVKAMGDLQEFSYGFDIVESEPISAEDAKSQGYGGEGTRMPQRRLRRLKVHEVSPVLLGAGEGTRTLALKNQGKSFADELKEVVASVESVRNRAADVMAMRTEKGKDRPLGEESTVLLERVQAELKALEELLSVKHTAECNGKATAAPDCNMPHLHSATDTANDEVRAAYLRFVSSEL